MVALAFTAGLLPAEVVPEIRVRSELAEREPAREILSPAVPRNGWSTFQITILGEPGTPFHLHVGQNPEDFVPIKLYLNGNPVDLPLEDEIPAKTSSLTVLLDVWVPRETEVRRFKLEPQVFFPKMGWIVYPMEVRVVEASVPEPAQPVQATAPTRSKPGDLARNILCGRSERLSRNLAQDQRLTKVLPAEAVERRLLRALGAADAKTWCAATKLPANPEWYLPFRDYLLNSLSSRQ